jgi:hypothetical protein
MSEEDHCKINLQPIFETEGFRIKKNCFVGGRRVARWYIFKPKIPVWENFQLKMV